MSDRLRSTSKMWAWPISFGACVLNKAGITEGSHWRTENSQYGGWVSNPGEYEIRMLKDLQHSLFCWTLNWIPRSHFMYKQYNIPISSVLPILCIYLAQISEQKAIISPCSIHRLVLVTERVFTARYELYHCICTVQFRLVIVFLIIPFDVFRVFCCAE